MVQSVIPKGSVVQVQDRCWIGCNKLGGVAFISKSDINGFDPNIQMKGLTYNVRYVLDRRVEKDIAAKWITLQQFDDSNEEDDS